MEDLVIQVDNEDPCYPIPRSIKKRVAKAMDKQQMEKSTKLTVLAMRDSTEMTQAGIARRLKVSINKVRRWSRKPRLQKPK